jgi:hypothetical protein
VVSDRVSSEIEKESDTPQDEDNLVKLVEAYNSFETPVSISISRCKNFTYNT